MEYSDTAKHEPDHKYTKESDDFIENLNKKWKAYQDSRGPKKGVLV